MGLAFVFIVIHWIGDFVFQNSYMALNKSKEWRPLLYHTGVYTLVWWIALMLFIIYNNYFTGLTAMDFGWDWKIVLFFPITFITHTITDYYTSRITSRQFAAQEFYKTPPKLGAFAVIGLDQILHYAQLFLTYKLLTL